MHDARRVNRFECATDLNPDSDRFVDPARRIPSDVVDERLTAGASIPLDHIIPRSVCPELDNTLYNLEFMPATLNGRKADKITDRQVPVHMNQTSTP